MALPAGPFPASLNAGGRLLLVGLPPSAPIAVLTGTKRSAHASCSWGMGASARSQRLWKPALPAGPLGARRPIAPAEQGIAAPVLKTLVCRLFFPIVRCSAIFSGGRICNGKVDVFPFTLLRGRNDRTGGEMTLPCPAGKGRCRCAEATLFAPAGKGASELARLILVCRGGKQKIRAFCPSKTVWQARRKDGEKEPHWTVRAFLCEHPARGSAQDHLPTPFTPPVFTQSSRGETGGLCPHPLKGSIP